MFILKTVVQKLQMTWFKMYIRKLSTLVFPVSNICYFQVLFSFMINIKIKKKIVKELQLGVFWTLILLWTEIMSNIKITTVKEMQLKIFNKPNPIFKRCQCRFHEDSLEFETHFILLHQETQNNDHEESVSTKNLYGALSGA